MLRRLGVVGLMLALGWMGVAVSAPSGPVTASNGWFRYLLPTIPAGGFVTLHNHGAKRVILDGVSVAACSIAMLHRSEERSGMDRMVMVQSIAIPTHGQLRFQPGSYHVMCMQPKMTVGQTVQVIFHFSQAPDLTVPFKVYGADQKPATK